MPAPNSEQYRATIGRWAEKLTDDNLLALARTAIQDTAETVIDLTPVDTGFLVGSWQPALTAPVLETGGLGADVSTPKIALTIVEMKLGDVFYYTNVVEYAKYQEFGTSRMAGRHMVAQAVANWQNIVRSAAVKLGFGA